MNADLIAEINRILEKPRKIVLTRRRIYGKMVRWRSSVRRVIYGRRGRRPGISEEAYQTGIPPIPEGGKTTILDHKYAECLQDYVILSLLKILIDGKVS